MRYIQLTMWLRRFGIGGLIFLAGCSVKTYALSSVADALSASGDLYARDDDPELVRDSIPVILKTMEQLRDALPKHQGIRLALVRTATALGVGFVKDEAERLEDRDVEASRAIFARARRLFLRGRDYGLEGLDLSSPGFSVAFMTGTPEDRRRVLVRAKKKDVPLLYWTGAAWASAITSAKENMKLVGEVPRVEAIMQRALELDEAFDEGAIHEFFIAYDASRSEAQGGGKARAKAHFERARALSRNKLSPLLTYAEAVSVDTQNKQEFKRLLEEVLAFDVERDLHHRLVNVLSQRRARWLLSRIDELFAE
jgi:predicted anti-sigma-YlaC factor YlaD